MIYNGLKHASVANHILNVFSPQIKTTEHEKNCVMGQ